MEELPGSEKSDTIRLLVSIQYTNVTDEQTPHDDMGRAMRSIALQ